MAKQLSLKTNENLKFILPLGKWHEFFLWENGIDFYKRIYSMHQISALQIFPTSSYTNGRQTDKQALSSFINVNLFVH